MANHKSEISKSQIPKDSVPKLLATHLCEDALAGLAGRLTLYNLFGERYAAAWPALVPRLVVANSWLREGPSINSGQAELRAGGPSISPSIDSGQGNKRDVFIERVVILSPDQQRTVAEATSVLEFEVLLHTTISRFADVVLPTPGTYRVQVWLGREQVADYPLVAIDTSKKEAGQ
jgi:hypothetical protein